MKIFRRVISMMVIASMLVCICSVSASALIFSDGTFNYTLTNATKSATVVGYFGKDTVVEIPSSYNGYTVTSIDDMVFQGKSFIEKVKIPSTVNEIGDYAFSNCTSLKSVTVPETVTTLGNGVFSGCTSLVYANIYASITKLPDNTFYNCSSLAEVNLSADITELGGSTFYNCTSLGSLNSLKLMKKIGQLAFYNSGLRKATVSDALDEIPRLAFGNCNNLVKIMIPETVTVIDQEAFTGSSQLVIYGYTESYAEEYADTNSITFVSMDGKLMGDVNLDGYVNVNDVTYLQRYIAQFADCTLNDEAKILADTTDDGRINILDVTAIQWIIASK